MLDFKQGNKELLQALVDSSKELVEKQYTPDSWSKLQEAINNSEKVLADENAMQEEVDSTLEALNVAINSLVKIEVKKEALQSLVNKLEKIESKGYSESTWAVFEKALNEAKEILAMDFVTQEEVDLSYNTLIKAYLDLRLIPDKSKLEEIINKVNELDLSKYTDETVEELKAKLSIASKVFNNEEATQEEINAASLELDEALNNLIAKGNDNNSDNDNVDDDKNNNGNNDSDKDNNNNNNDSDKNNSNNVDKEKDNLPQTGVERGYLEIISALSLIIGATLIYKKRSKKVY